ncbi:hypothetical protein [Streptococcus danieliae]|uniref:hypothetical protein n=1 Tax=Streptococcus danieliae TaxID=747656 RepID=UPI0021C9DD2B|nr:hypothetical protein [Streptococcus danieliae]MCU0082345.1 hypothetical protein [Streptococcus danieliae]
MTTFQIYKYDKSSKEYYGDWTVVSDIGNYFHGEQLTLEEYLKTETHYTQVVLKLLKYLHIDRLQVKYLSKLYSLHWNQQHTFFNQELSTPYQKLEQGIELNQQEIEDTIRLNLRGAVNCLLYHPKIEVFMGYDYYMYVKLNQNFPLDIISSIIKREKLYWEALENFDYFYEDIAENRLALGYTWSDGSSNPSGDYHHDLQISKEPPADRLKATWTAFDGVTPLHLDDYLRIEQAYLALVLDFLKENEIREFQAKYLSFNSEDTLGVSSDSFSAEEESLFHHLQTIEDLEPIYIQEKNFVPFFRLLFKGRLNAWIKVNSLSIQFDSSYRLYLSFYGHKKEVQQLVEKHGLYWQERQPPYHEAVDFS